MCDEALDIVPQLKGLPFPPNEITTRMAQGYLTGDSLCDEKLDIVAQLHIFAFRHVTLGEDGKVDVRLPGKGNSNLHGVRPVHLIITMMK